MTIFGGVGGLGLSSQSKFFQWFLKSWNFLSNEGSLACHTYCDTGHPFIMVISEDLWHSHLFPSFSIKELSLEPGHPTFRVQSSNPLRDTGYPFVMVISEDPWHSHLLTGFFFSFFFVLTTWVCRGWDSNTQPSAWEANSPTDCATAAFATH